VRRIVLLCVLLAGVIVGVLLWRSSQSHQQSGVASVPTITKQPENFVNRTFDPANPPSDLPEFGPGELAVCDSNFISDAHVAGEAHETDSTHAIVTVTGVTVNLQLDITIWVPNTASQHVTEHEQGHREISEHFYATADKLAAKIAAPYIGKRFEVSGSDLHAEISKALQQMGAEITAEYDRELNPNPTQLRYDAITDHSRNDVLAKDAVAQALSENPAASTKLTPHENNFALVIFFTGRRRPSCPESRRVLSRLCAARSPRLECICGAQTTLGNTRFSLRPIFSSP
jgi:hypothetical protein